ncbi:MAG: chaperone modulator CbpM [Halioglobus sp.]
MSDLLVEISCYELLEYPDFTEQVIMEIVEYGIAKPLKGKDVAEWVFDTNSGRWLQKAVRLYCDLDIDWIAVAMIIDLLQQNEALEKQNQRYEQQLRRFIE